MSMSRCFLCLLVLTVLAPLGTVQATSVIGFWDFEDAVASDFPSGAILLDSSGNDRHLRSMGAQSLGVGSSPGTTAVFFGGAGSASTGFLQFDPGGTFTNSGLTASSSDIVLSSTGGSSESFTIEAIVKLPHNADHSQAIPQFSEGGILGKGAFVADSGVDQWFLNAIHNDTNHPNSVEGFIADGASPLGTSRAAGVIATNIADGWHHIAMVRKRNADTLELFVDGVSPGPLTSSAANGVFDNAVGNFVVGARGSNPTNKFFRGGIDMVKISHEALDPSQFMLIVPEPATNVMILLGAMGLAALRKRR